MYSIDVKNIYIYIYHFPFYFLAKCTEREGEFYQHFRQKLLNYSLQLEMGAKTFAYWDHIFCIHVQILQNVTQNLIFAKIQFFVIFAISKLPIFFGKLDSLFFDKVQTRLAKTLMKKKLFRMVLLVRFCKLARLFA